jgi:LacI family transcriptional regulator
MAAAARMTLKYIAGRLSLSVTTVSRVLNGQARQYRISEKTEAAVRQLAAEVNFSPNRVARGLRLNKTESIGVVIPDVSNPFFAGIVRQIALGARGCHYSVIVCDSQETEELEIESLDLLRSRGVEGIVLCPVGRSAEHLVRFEEGDLPIVLADRYFPGLRLPYVVSDNFSGARVATDHLIRAGHRRIACLQGLVGTSPNEDRLRGYGEALTAHQISLDESLIAGEGFGEQNGYIAAKLLLKAAHEFTAILAFSNLISLGAIRALSEEGLRIPGDISLVSFDDQPYSAYLAAPMTTISQSSSEMGQIAVKLLFDRIRRPDRVVRGGILLPTSLVLRGSVRTLNESTVERDQRHVCG